MKLFRGCVCEIVLLAVGPDTGVCLYVLLARNTFDREAGLAAEPCDRCKPW